MVRLSENKGYNLPIERPEDDYWPDEKPAKPKVELQKRPDIDTGKKTTSHAKGGEGHLPIDISIGDLPDGLIPRGNGWYTTPEVIDPRQCEFYSESIWCGGNPLLKPQDMVGIDIEIGINECGIGVNVTGRLGITLPTHTIAYMNEECRRKKEKPPPPLEDDEKGPSPLKFPDGIPDDAIVACCVSRDVLDSIVAVYAYPELVGKGGYQEKSIRVASVGDLIAPVEPIERIPDYNYGRVLAKIPVNSVQASLSTLTNPETNSTHTTPLQTFGVTDQNWNIYSPSASGEYLSYYDYNILQLGGQFNPPDWWLIYGKYGNIRDRWEGRLGYQVTEVGFVNQGIYSTSFTRGVRKEQYKLAAFKIIDPGKGNPWKRNPFDDYFNRRKKDCNCMSCCSPSQQTQNKNDSLLREILRNVREINKKLGDYPVSVTLFDADDNRPGAQSKNVSIANVAKGQQLIVQREEKNAKSIGIDNFPIYVPSSIVEDESNGILGDIGDLKNKIFKQRIESIAELLIWKVKNDNEIFGKWQEYIEIQDSDPEQKGNQPKRVVLPNMARSFRELVLLNSVQIKTTGLILDLLLKTCIEVISIKKATAVTEAIIRDVQDFLDYPTTEKNLDIPVGFTIPNSNDSPDDKEDIQRFMQHSHLKAIFDDWTGEGSIHDMLVVLLDAASMIRADKFGRA